MTFERARSLGLEAHYTQLRALGLDDRAIFTAQGNAFDHWAVARRIGTALARWLRRPLSLLFPDVPANHPAMGSMLMNMAANMIGLTNAATPLGLRAMNDLEKLNRHPGTATNAMCTFLALTLGFLARVAVKEPTLLLLAVPFLLARAYGLGFGFAWGLWKAPTLASGPSPPSTGAAP